MIVEIHHASKYGNGAKVAEELRRILAAKGHQVNVHHIDEARPKELPHADLYVFGSPTRFGRPIGGMRRFLKKAVLPSGTRYAIFATHGDVLPNKKTGKMPSDDEIARMRKTLPEMDEVLQKKGCTKVAEKMFLVSGDELKGHLLEGWQAKAEEFAAAILG